MHFLLLALSLAYPTPPQCSQGTAWVNYASDPPAMLLQAKCDGCEAECRNAGTRSEGWYSSCDGALIQWADCAYDEPVACTMDAKMCPDGSYVGREGPNCEFAACPCSQDECGPAMGMPSTRCSDGSVAGPVCERNPETGKCGYTVTECRMVEPPSCAPYVCADGTKVDSCTPEGTVINYFAEPCLTHGGEEGAPFSDVTADHPNADAIFYVKEQGIVQGYEDGSYKPDNTINRAEFVKILMGAFPGGGRMCKIAPFSDVDQSAWYASFAHTARCQGVVSGYDDGTFRPSNTINFVEAAKIIVKAFGLEASTTVPTCEGECPWYEGYVRILQAHGAIPTSIISFDQPITRGEMAEMIYRLKTGNTDKPSQTYDALAGSAEVETCAAAFERTRECPEDRCYMDCAQRVYPNGGLGCPPGCFEKP